MKRLIALCIALLLLLPCVALAQNDQKVVDLAGLFTNEQQEELDGQARQIMAGLDDAFDLVVCTTADAGGKTAQAFADDYYDYNSYGMDEEYSGVLLLLDMDNREVAVSTTGLAIQRIGDNEVEYILDAMYDNASREDYLAVFADGLAAVERALESESIRDVYPGTKDSQDAPDTPQDVPGMPQGMPDTPQGALHITPGVLMVAAALSLLLAGGTAAGVTTSYRAKKAPDNYPLSQNAQLNLTQQRDVFLHRHVTRTKIERSSSSGGGGSTHTGSSGRSHGGGSRKF